MHLRPLLLDSVKQLLHIGPWSLEAKRRPLCAANDADEPRLVIVFIRGSVIDSGYEIRTVVVDVVSGLLLRGAVVHVARDPKHLGYDVVILSAATYSWPMVSSLRRSCRVGALKTVRPMISCLVMVGSGSTADLGAEADDG